MSDSSAINEELQRHLNKLGEDFAARLGQELPQLALDGQTLLRCHESAERLQQVLKLRDQLHKLAGAAGTFGLVKLGQRARELEQQADGWLQALQQGQQKNIYAGNLKICFCFPTFQVAASDLNIKQFRYSWPILCHSCCKTLSFSHEKVIFTGISIFAGWLVVGFGTGYAHGEPIG